VGQQQEANGVDDAARPPDAQPATGAGTEQAGALPETTGPPDGWVRLEPSEAEIERWAERERERRRAWLYGPTPAERAAWRQQERARRRASLDAAAAPDSARRAPPTLREAQLAAEGAASLTWRVLKADGATGPLQAWSRRGLDALVRAGREWEAEVDGPCGPRREPPVVRRGPAAPPPPPRSPSEAGAGPGRAARAGAAPWAPPGPGAREPHRLTAARAAARTAVCLLKVFPVLPSWPFDWATPRPVVARLRYRTPRGDAGGALYRPPSAGPHPGIVVCLGVVPFGVEHPLVPRLGEALARAGFAALLHWSPAMRDYRLDPEDVGDVVAAYQALLARPDVDPARSGLLGTCVGGAFALLAAASPGIRDRVAFVVACAPYASMWTLARDVASASRRRDGRREAWAVDPLTRTVYVHSLTALLDPGEARRLRDACADRRHRPPDLTGVSEAGRAVVPLLTALDLEEAERALRHLPADLGARLTALSPTAHLHDLRAPLVVLLHDRDDPVIPVGESRRLRDALAARGGGRVRYAEVTGFRHLNPATGNPSPPAPPLLARELVRVARAMYPLFQLLQRAAAAEPPAAHEPARPASEPFSAPPEAPGAWP
jgi:dienelactone hydrolase